MCSRSLFVSLLMAICTISVHAQVPSTLGVQGVVTGLGGTQTQGAIEMVFRLFDTATGGVALWSETQNVRVQNDVYAVVLGSENPLTPAFDTPYWLEVEVRETDRPPEVLPRVGLAASAYSLNTRSIPDGIVTEEKIADGQVVRSLNGLHNHLTLVGGAGITIETGEEGSLRISATDTGGASSEIAGLRIEENAISPNLLGGHSDNSASPGVAGAAIGGGGQVGTPSLITDSFGTIGGGRTNLVGNGDEDPTNAQYATIAGGQSNIARAEGATVGGGVQNVANGLRATVGGGNNNSANEFGATIAGGQDNEVGFGGNSAAIGGGNNNTASGEGATVSGGLDNFATFSRATVGGGSTNEAMSEGTTVGGGVNNKAGDRGGEPSSGRFATISGGSDNIASGSRTTIGGGSSHTASGDGTTISGGLSNVASGPIATVSGGESNTASGDLAAVSGGNGNTASGSRSAVSGGESNTASGEYAAVGGGFGNRAVAHYATVSGGGWTIRFDASTTNRVTDDYGTVGGGGNNQAGDADDISDDAPFATVGGGESNTAGGGHATVAGGSNNTASGFRATVGGGQNNSASDQATTIAGGSGNRASGQGASVVGGAANIASSGWASVGGGLSNTASGFRSTVSGGAGNTTDAQSATVGGGESNTADGLRSTVSGGNNNAATGQGAAIPGGEFNTASGNTSFAAGLQAKAMHHGCFVWADATPADVTSTASNQFIARAGGGVWFYSNSALTAGVILPPGSGAWSTLSDRNAKANGVSVKGRDILDRLSTLPIQTWNYKSQDPSVRHIGPMAQDFYAAFGLGEDDRHIATVDADGVALSAIQELYGIVIEKEAQIEALKQQSADLESRLTALEHMIKTITPGNETSP